MAEGGCCQVQWELLDAASLSAAASDKSDKTDGPGGLCVVPLGVLEKHGRHLPLGTDVICAHSIALRAAEIEPAVVFPCFIFGQIAEARHLPGAVSVAPELYGPMLGATLDEIGRNGFKKIILYNFHGGNVNWLRFFVDCLPREQKSYLTYLYDVLVPPEALDSLETCNGHACELETSLMLYLRPNHVNMEKIPANPAEPQDRLQDLPLAKTPLNWYADFPEHYAGDARKASAKKGKLIYEACAAKLAKFYRSVKEDGQLQKLDAEFFSRVEKIGIK
ncbi:MAG: creatininase family protein [Defluviitaleaceae bacterium]|nr:creatininase family protein [Defluviitaleaceae bacterium]